MYTAVAACSQGHRAAGGLRKPPGFQESHSQSRPHRTGKCCLFHMPVQKSRHLEITGLLFVLCILNSHLPSPSCHRSVLLLSDHVLFTKLLLGGVALPAAFARGFGGGRRLPRSQRQAVAPPLPAPSHRGTDSHKMPSQQQRPVLCLPPGTCFPKASAKPPRRAPCRSV